MNPFQFGSPVRDDFFFDNPAFKNFYRNYIDNKIHTVLIGPRRYGKTSFILNLLNEYKAKTKKDVLYIDLFNVTGHRDFYLQLITTLKKERSLLSNLKHWLKILPATLRPVLSLEVSQSGEFELNITQENKNNFDVKEMILFLLDEIISNSKDLIFVLDEFQAIADFEDDNWLEATLRQKMQLHKNVVFIFTGSRKSIIHEMFNHSSRPFYRSCQIIDFPRPNDDFSFWIQKKFKNEGIIVTIEDVKYIEVVMSNTANYVQMVCFHLVAIGHKKINREIIDTVIDQVVLQNAYAYQTILKSLPINQQRVLRMSAKIKEGVYTKDIIKEFEVASPQHVAQAIKSLKEKQILDEETARGRIVFDDPLFELWLKRDGL
jgi:AAA+ ATPase superfamily predicted ATPase